MTEILKVKLYGLDRSAKTINNIDINDISQDMIDYINKQKQDLVDKPNSRNYITESNTTEVFDSIINIINANDIDGFGNKIANRLLRTEVNVQERYKMTKVKTGSLLLIHFYEEEVISFLVIKVEHNTFLDEGDFIKHIGLPLEKETLKSCLYQFNDELELLDIIAFDTNPTISDYWWNTFLELKPLKTDEENTKKAFAAIENIVGRKLRAKAPADFSLIRNNLIGYFKTKNSFNITEVADYILGSYVPIEPTIQVDQMKQLIIELPNKKGFDQSFEIISKQIDARIRTKITINDHVDLKIQDHVENLQSLIHSEIGEDGKKYIKIVASDNAYNRFQFKREN
jgi:hypothetical protein